MQTKCHANLPQTCSAHFILEYMKCSRVFKALLGHVKKKKKKKKGTKGKSCNSTCVFAVVEDEIILKSFTSNTSPQRNSL